MEEVALTVCRTETDRTATQVDRRSTEAYAASGFGKNAHSSRISRNNESPRAGSLFDGNDVITLSLSNVIRWDVLSSNFDHATSPTQASNASHTEFYPTV